MSLLTRNAQGPPAHSVQRGRDAAVTNRAAPSTLLPAPHLGAERTLWQWRCRQCGSKARRAVERPGVAALGALEHERKRKHRGMTSVTGVAA